MYPRVRRPRAAGARADCRGGWCGEDEVLKGAELDDAYDGLALKRLKLDALRLVLCS